MYRNLKTQKPVKSHNILLWREDDWLLKYKLIVYTLHVDRYTANKTRT